MKRCARRLTGTMFNQAQLVAVFASVFMFACAGRDDFSPQSDSPVPPVTAPPSPVTPPTSQPDASAPAVAADAAPAAELPSYAVSAGGFLNADGKVHEMKATCEAGDTTSLDTCTCVSTDKVKFLGKSSGVDEDGRAYCTCSFGAIQGDADAGPLYPLFSYASATTYCVTPPAESAREWPQESGQE